MFINIYRCKGILVSIVIIPGHVGDNSYHQAMSNRFSCDGMSDHAVWNEGFYYWDGESMNLLLLLSKEMSSL